MKQKTRSSAKKRIKVRKSGTVSVEKASKRHLLSQKSKKQKRMGEMPVHPSRMQAIRRNMPGLVK